ncbi:MAG TPA: PAS domain-containing protein, partial [Agitococcus sp.]|nr:PAS domain-containing protein [Agitococcus sp.]
MLGTSFCKRVLENLSTAVLVVDEQLCVVYLNPSAEMLLAVSRSRTIGQPLAHIFIDCEGDGSILKMAQTLKTAHPFTKREAHLRVNGLHEVTVDYTVSSLLTPQSPPELLIEIQPIDRLLRISR